MQDIPLKNLLGGLEDGGRESGRSMLAAIHDDNDCWTKTRSFAFRGTSGITILPHIFVSITPKYIPTWSDSIY